MTGVDNLKVQDLAEKIAKAKAEVQALAMVNTAGMTADEKRKLNAQYELAKSLIHIWSRQMSEKSEIYVKLEDEDFLKLVSGGQVDKTDRNGNQVHLILSDIGWDRMTENIRTAMSESK